MRKKNDDDATTTAAVKPFRKTTTLSSSLGQQQQCSIPLLVLLALYIFLVNYDVGRHLYIHHGVIQEKILTKTINQNGVVVVPSPCATQSQPFSSPSSAPFGAVSLRTGRMDDDNKYENQKQKVLIDDKVDKDDDDDDNDASSSREDQYETNDYGDDDEIDTTQAHDDGSTTVNNQKRSDSNQLSDELEFILFGDDATGQSTLSKWLLLLEEEETKLESSPPPRTTFSRTLSPVAMGLPQQQQQHDTHYVVPAVNSRNCEDNNVVNNQQQQQQKKKKKTTERGGLAPLLVVDGAADEKSSRFRIHNNNNWQHNPKNTKLIIGIRNPILWFQETFEQELSSLLRDAAARLVNSTTTVSNNRTSRSTDETTWTATLVKRINHLAIPQRVLFHVQLNKLLRRLTTNNNDSVTTDDNWTSRTLLSPKINTMMFHHKKQQGTTIQQLRLVDLEQQKQQQQPFANSNDDDDDSLSTFQNRPFRQTPPNVSNPIFLYEASQLNDDRKETRRARFQQDLAHFLGRRQDDSSRFAPPPPSVPSSFAATSSRANTIHHLTRTNDDNVRNNRSDATIAAGDVAVVAAAEFDICSARFKQLRTRLLAVARSASYWIRQYLLTNDHLQVTTSSPHHFQNVLKSWYIDPCLDQLLVDDDSSNGSGGNDDDMSNAKKHSSLPHIVKDDVTTFDLEEFPPLEDMLASNLTGQLLPTAVDWLRLTPAEAWPIAKRLHEHRFLQFAIVGHCKTGTTAVMNWLARAHPRILMFQEELHSLSRGKLAEFIRTMYLLPPPGKQQLYFRGYKAPSDIVLEPSRTLLRNYFNFKKGGAKLIIGLRHPVRWFESFYNFHALRTGKGLPPEQVFELFARKGLFHVNLALMGKTNLTSPDELMLLQPHLTSSSSFPLDDDGVVKKPRKMENYVFIYDSTQLFDPNETRNAMFREDMQHFLDVPFPLPRISPLDHSVRRTTARKKHSNSVPLELDICEEEYRPLREKLLETGRNASLWILQYFLPLEDVYVSSPEFFAETLVKWSQDPCDSPI